VQAVDDVVAKYGLDDYDNEEAPGGVSMSGAGMGNGLAGLLYHNPGQADPYITLRDDPEDDEIEDFRCVCSCEHHICSSIID
jgi:periodic tryptophan protein 1